MSNRTLRLEPLTAEAFAGFGTVIDMRGSGAELINEGNTHKFADLIPLDCSNGNGRVAAHLYRSVARELPLEIRMLERHPLGSQAFWPLSRNPYAIVVAPPGRDLDESAIRSFVTDGHQAIQYHRGTWHHYQISLGADSDYLVLDREGPGNNCDEVSLSQPFTLTL